MLTRRRSCRRTAPVWDGEAAARPLHAAPAIAAASDDWAAATRRAGAAIVVVIVAAAVAVVVVVVWDHAPAVDEAKTRRIWVLEAGVASREGKRNCYHIWEAL